MSEENKTEEAVQSEAPKAAAPESDGPAATAAAGGILNTLMTNPKAMYAAAGAVVVVILALVMGGSKEPAQTKAAVVSVGQTVMVENPNGGNTQLSISPGMMGVSDPEDTEQNVCLVKGAAKATVEEEQIAGMLSYVKVKVMEGTCEGKSGWTSKVNIKAG